MTPPNHSIGAMLNLPTLSRAERAVAAIVAADHQRVLKFTISELAHAAGVSPPTVTRFCRRLGYPSYRTFKLAVAQIPPLQRNYRSGA